MSFKAKDGKSFGNRQQQTRYDEVKSAAPKEEKSAAGPKDDDMSSATTDHGDDSGGSGDVSSQDIGEVVGQHGPATDIHITVSPEGGATVESTHGGKKHKSQHGSADEAHMHAAKASGLNPPAAEQPMGQEMGAIPGM